LLEATVHHGQFLNVSFLRALQGADAALPTATRQRLERWVSDGPLSSFSYNLLASRLRRELPFANDNTLRPLVGLPGFDDADQLATEILQALSGLPTIYELFVPLPLGAYEESQDHDRQYDLTEKVSLFAPGPDFSQSFPLGSGDGTALSMMMGLSDDGPHEWVSNRYYLRVTVDGYISDFAPTRPIEDLDALVRSLLGLLMASGVDLERERSLASLWRPTQPVYVYRVENDKRTRQHQSQLAVRTSAGLLGLGWRDLDDFHGDNWPRVMRFVQRRLQAALAAPSGSSQARDAAQWYFDSHNGDSALLQFVEATVALEIMVGDKATSDVIGIKELLANRTAYLLATSHKERAEILSEIKKLYDTRSAIVHRGKNRLESAEATQLGRLRYYCHRLLHKELELLAPRESDAGHASSAI
jgi:hypothetical protein